MRTTFALAGLAAAASAATTVTEWAEVTVTSCTGTYSNCPYTASQTWGNWDPAKATSKTTTKKAKTTAVTWSDWSDPAKAKTTTTTAAWSVWDPAKAKTTTTTAAWSVWDPAKAKTTTTKPASYEWSQWNSMTSSKKTNPKTTAKPSVVTWEYVGSGKTKTVTKTEYVTVYVSGQPSVSTVYYECGYNSQGVPYTSQVDVYGKPVTNTNAYQTWQYPTGQGNGAAQTWATVSTKTACPAYTSTGVPSWYGQLPANVVSSMGGAWNAASAPSDWCYYSYSTASPASTWAAAGSQGSPAAASASATWSNWASPTGTAPVAKYTGGASRNAVGLIAGAGLAALLL